MRSHLLPELKRCFASTYYEKILIVRDRLSSLVCSILSIRSLMASLPMSWI